LRAFDTESGTMQEWSTGDVLVEVEPIRYELEIRLEDFFVDKKIVLCFKTFVFMKE